MQAATAAFLINQPTPHQVGDVVGQGRTQDIQVLLNFPNGQAVWARANQQAENREARRIAKLIQAFGSSICVHGSIMRIVQPLVNYISRNIELLSLSFPAAATPWRMSSKMGFRGRSVAVAQRSVELETALAYGFADVFDEKGNHLA